MSASVCVNNWVSVEREREGERQERECGHKHVLPLLYGGKNGSTFKWNPTGNKDGSCVAAGIHIDC